MFKNLMVYRLHAPWAHTVEAFDAALQGAVFAPCSASQDKSAGWVAPRGHAHGALAEVVDGQWIAKLQVESKSVPGGVLRRRVDEQVAAIEASTGRKPGKKERRDLLEEARNVLLPQAFSKYSSTLVWVCPAENLLVLDCSSSGRADEVMELLRRALPDLAVSLLDTQTAPATAMAHWLREREAPVGFSIDRECELKAPDESKAVVRYTRHTLDIEEVAQHVAQGKQPTRLALTWNERVSFVLTEGWQLRKVAVLDVVLEDKAGPGRDTRDDHFDADIAIATGELLPLLTDLVEALDGEAPRVGG